MATTATRRPARAPRFVALFNPLAQRLLGAGVPLGPNALLTIEGRRTGLPRTVAVALIEAGERRWVLSTFGDVNWSRNLRAAGRAQLRAHGQVLDVVARELDPAEAAGVIREVLVPIATRLPIGKWLLRRVLGAADLLDDPEAAARRRPMFELTRNQEISF
jgi:deazaflavin-dependent oxidoreductase (nitroreductase family)